LYRAHAVAGMVEERETDRQRSLDDFTGLQEKFQALSAQLQDLRRESADAPTPGPPKRGLNLNKRSQALRMHRQGDPVEQIAAALELPRQEVDLLVKVHRIVLSGV
jgi:hypothetical protein